MNSSNEDLARMLASVSEVLARYPEAVKIIEVHGREAKRIADYKLHVDDLVFAGHCIARLRDTPPEDELIREALWRTALVHTMKCFMVSNSRSQISENKVFKGEPPDAKAAFKFLMDIRSKHVVHDENSFAMVFIGAILNKPGAPTKVADISTVVTMAETCNIENLNNLGLIVVKAHAWVQSALVEETEKLIGSLELERYEDLAQRNAPNYRIPTTLEVHDKR